MFDQILLDKCFLPTNQTEVLHILNANNDIQPNAKYAIDSERSIEQSRFVEIVEARVQEIIENAWHQVPTEYRLSTNSPWID